MNFIKPDIEDYAFAHTRPEPELLTELAEFTREEMELPQMLTGRLEGRFLKMLVAISGARRILEIGMFTGYSALSMAEAMPSDGRIITCDIDPRAEKVAKSFFARSPFGERISIAMGPALETIAGLEGSLDLVFLDADKENYPQYYEAVFPKVRSGGLIVVDNCLWSGSVLAPKAESDEAIARLNSRVAGDSRVENVILTVRDGINLIRKI